MAGPLPIAGSRKLKLFGRGAQLGGDVGFDANKVFSLSHFSSLSCRESQIQLFRRGAQLRGDVGLDANNVLGLAGDGGSSSEESDDKADGSEEESGGRLLFVSEF